MVTNGSVISIHTPSTEHVRRAMKHQNRFVQKIAYHLFSAVLLVTIAAAATVGESNSAKKFLTKPLLIEDQGSFFIGGVPKVTNYATVPQPNNPSQSANAPNQITIGQMYVQFQIPARKKP